MYWSACWGKANIVFLLEDSCHVGKENFQKMLDIIDDLVEEIPVGAGHIQVGVNTFTCTARTEFELGKYTDGSKIIKAVQKISYTGGKVNTGEAIEFTRKNSFIGMRCYKSYFCITEKLSFRSAKSTNWINTAFH